MREGEEISALMRLLREGSDADVRRFFALLTPPMLADCLESLPDEEDRVRVVRLMNAPLAAEVLREIEESDRDEILEELSDRRVAAVAAELKSDDAADLVGSLSPDKQERVLEALEDEDREEIEELLGYGEDTAGGIMQTEFVSVVSDLSVGRAIEAVRAADIGDVGEIHEVFVVDANKRLVGVVSPADLLHEDADALLRDVMDAAPIKGVVTEDQEQIARRAREHDLATIPIVDDNGVLVGQVLHDDIADVIQEEATEDIAKLAGADPEELQESVWYAVRTRAMWLAPAFCGGLVVAFYLASVEADLNQAPLLIAFLPIILGMAGNVGTQTSALTVRALALGRVDHDRTLKVIGRQFVTGLSLGAAFGVALCIFVFFRAPDANVRLYMTACGLAILTAMTVGTTMGVSVPILLHRLGFDPAIASSPFVQTANDVTGACILILVSRAVDLIP